MGTIPPDRCSFAGIGRIYKPELDEYGDSSTAASTPPGAATLSDPVHCDGAAPTHPVGASAVTSGSPQGGPAKCKRAWCPLPANGGYRGFCEAHDEEHLDAFRDFGRGEDDAA